MKKREKRRRLKGKFGDIKRTQKIKKKKKGWCWETRGKKKLENKGKK